MFAVDECIPNSSRDAKPPSSLHTLIVGACRVTEFYRLLFHHFLGLDALPLTSMSTQFECQRSVLGVQSPGNPPAAPNATVAVDHECSCTLQLHPHRIADDEWAAHRAEWEAKKAAAEEDMVDLVSGSTVDKKVRGHAEERQDAPSMKDYEAAGIRWSELARLPYWDDIDHRLPQVVDPPNMLEGCVSWTQVTQAGHRSQDGA